MTSAARQGAPAYYWEAEVELAPESEEVWSLFCFDRGASGAQTLSENPRGLTVLYFFEAGKPRRAGRWPQAFAREFPGVPPPRRIALRRRKTENWQDGWRAHFVPTPAGRGFMVCPPWSVPEAKALDGRKPLLIEPGQGFGTGGHASTALALAALEEAASASIAAKGAPPAALLDVGIGSGILSVAARMLAVGEAWGLDIDGRVMAEVRRNFALNGLAPAPRLVQGGPPCLRGRRFPLLVANLTTPVLLHHRLELVGLVEPGGTLILSGILGSESQQLLGPYLEAGCRLLEATEREEWWACRLSF